MYAEVLPDKEETPQFEKAAAPQYVLRQQRMLEKQKEKSLLSLWQLRERYKYILCL